MCVNLINIHVTFVCITMIYHNLHTFAKLSNNENHQTFWGNSSISELGREIERERERERERSSKIKRRNVEGEEKVNFGESIMYGH